MHAVGKSCTYGKKCEGSDRISVELGFGKKTIQYFKNDAKQFSATFNSPGAQEIVFDPTLGVGTAPGVAATSGALPRRLHRSEHYPRRLPQSSWWWLPPRGLLCSLHGPSRIYIMEKIASVFAVPTASHALRFAVLGASPRSVTLTTSPPPPRHSIR